MSKKASVPAQEDKPYRKFETFAEFFQQAKQHSGYWVELAKLKFGRQKSRLSIFPRLYKVDLNKGEYECSIAGN
ncbi:MAG: hypothetical protein PHV34_07745 [Verrucomicrobiae bacterium]|nr:hypothetical protein [Verrucomicrobiae bacterium]